MHAQMPTYLLFCGNFKGQEQQQRGPQVAALIQHLLATLEGKQRLQEHNELKLFSMGSQVLVFLWTQRNWISLQLKCEMGMLCQTLPLFEAYGVFFIYNFKSSKVLKYCN